MSVEQITNYLRISDRIASSGQPEEHQFKSIAASGYRVVINLAMPNSDNAIPEEGYEVSARNMTYVHIPVPFDDPQPGHLRQFLGIMTAFSDRKVWVHCVVVNYRASAFLYQYQRLVLGMDEAGAKSAIHPSWQPDGVLCRFMNLTGEQLRR